MAWIFFLICWIISLLILIPALLKKQEINRQELQQWDDLIKERKAEIKALNSEQELQQIRIKEFMEQASAAEHTFQTISHLKAECENQVKNLQNSIQTLSQTEAAVKDNMEKAIDEKSKMLSKEYQDNSNEYMLEYNTTMKEMANEFTKNIAGKRAELHLLEDAIEDKQAVYEAIIEYEKRKAQEEEHKAFYKLNIPEEDLNEIKKIKEILPHLRNPEALNKVIWSVYYQKPYQDLIGRLFQSNKPSGIYKITSLIDNKIYIGQSVNVPNRFSEHIKRGLGAEPATKNRLYPAMMRQGVENFTFELLEEIPREKLDERENYWIQFFHSAEIGLNSNKGVKG